MTIRTMLSILLALAGLAVGSFAHAADNWPEWRGPTMDGHSDATDLPLEWSEDKNIKWKTPIHGRGWSTPVVWGNQIWLTTATPKGHEQFVVCVNATTGQIEHNIKLWQIDDPQFSNALNSYASPSPVIEDGRVYVHFGTYGTACLDTATGKTLWQRRDINCEHFMGPGSSPILYKDLLIFNVDGADVQYVIALSKHSGKTVWKTDRSFDYSKLNPDICKSYNTPIITQVDGKDQMISTGAQCVWAYDPNSGDEIWKLRFTGFSNASRPLVHDGMAIINTGYNKPYLIGMQLGGKGDVTTTHHVWEQKRNVPAKPSSIVVDNLMYMVSDNGIVTCLDPKTGEDLWRERISEGRNEFSASPIYAAGRLYFCSQTGKTVVIAPGRTLKVLAENELPDGFMASPAITGQSLILRTKSHLYRVEE